MYNPNDLALEIKIDAALRQFNKQPTRENFHALARLVGQRSPGRVAEMEAERGLA